MGRCSVLFFNLSVIDMLSVLMHFQVLPCTDDTVVNRHLEDINYVKMELKR